MVGKQGGSDPHHPAPAFRQDAEHDITSYLDKKKLAPSWANTSGNGLVSKLIWEGVPELKQDFETLMNGGVIVTQIDEQIVFNQLTGSRQAIWSLLLASGYLKVEHVTPQDPDDPAGKPVYTLRLTNREVCSMFSGMIRDWFNDASGFGLFVTASKTPHVTL